MHWIVGRFKWVMLVSGVMTCTMIQAAIAPQAALRSLFGDTLEGPLAEIVVRNWGALITLVGAMLVYGAFHPALRPLVLVVAGLSKITFIGLVLSFGAHHLGRQAGIAIAVDVVMIALFVAYLVSVRRRPALAAG